MKNAITPEQVRAGRALLDWSRDTLASKSGVSLRTLVSVEAGEGNPSKHTICLIRDALIKAGITFIENGGGIGVRLRRP